MSKATKICQDTENMTCEFDERVQLEIDDGTVVISAAEYRELVTKSAALDILTASIKAAGSLNDAVVRAVTGTTETNEMVPKSEADSYWRYYMEERSKTKELGLQVAALQRARDEMIEILRQNNIGEWSTVKVEEDKA